MALPVSAQRLDFLTDVRLAMEKHNITGVCIVYGIGDRVYTTSLGLDNDNKISFARIGEKVGDLLIRTGLQ
jgi:hypothetical protein